MGQLYTFAHELLTHFGAVVEKGSNSSENANQQLDVLLSTELTQYFGLPEFVRLTEGASFSDYVRLAYGGDLLDKMVNLATDKVPVCHARLHVPLPNTSDPLGAALNHYSGLNCVIRPAHKEPEDGWAGYLIVDYHYIADADERREGMVRVAINEETGVDLPNLVGLDTHPYLEAGCGEVQAICNAKRALHMANQAACRLVKNTMEHYIASLERRHQRDRMRLNSYFLELKREMEVQLERMRQRQVTSEELSSRQNKIDELLPELERKLAELKVRYRLHIEVRIASVMRVGIPVRRVYLQGKRRQNETCITVYQSGASRSFEPVRCLACGEGAFSFSLCDKSLHLFCANCARGCDSSKSCPVCQGKKH